MAEMSKAATLSVDGVAQSYISECTVEVMSEDKPVKTLMLGLAGYSDGAESAKVTGKGAIPLAGRQLDYRKLCRSHTTLPVSFKMGSSTITVEGRFMTVSESSSVDNPNGVDFNFEGRIISIS
jgi:hypothetical protein